MFEGVKAKEQAVMDFVDGLDMAEDRKRSLKETIYAAASMLEKSAVPSAQIAHSIPGFVEGLTGDRGKGLELIEMVKELTMAATLATYENIKGR